MDGRIFWDNLHPQVIKEIKNTTTEFKDNFKVFHDELGLTVDSNNITGAIVIKTEKPFIDRMMTSLIVRGFNYTEDASTININIGYYPYQIQTDPPQGPSFAQSGFVNLGDHAIKRVRGARDTNGNYVLILGDIEHKWSHPKIWIESAMFGFNKAPDDYMDSWTMKITEDISDLEIMKEFPNTSPNTDAVKTKVVDDLTTGGTSDALSAEQGVVLKGLIDANTAIDISNEKRLDTLDNDLLDATGIIDGHIHKKATDTVLGHVTIDDRTVRAVDGQLQVINPFTTADKTKLDGIVAEANKYTLPIATDANLGGIKPDGVTVSVDPLTGELSTINSGAIEAKNVSFDSTNELSSINVQQAIEEVFLVSSEIIKSVADSLGHPFDEKDGNTILKGKLATMKQYFHDVLNDMHIETLNTHTVTELIGKIYEIKDHLIEYGDEMDITAPNSIELIIGESVQIDRTVATLFKLIKGEIDQALYHCQFLPADADSFNANNNVVFNNKLALRKDNYVKDMILYGTETLGGRARNTYVFNPQANSVELTSFKVKDYNHMGIDWNRLSMTSNSTPAPYKTSASSHFLQYDAWMSFDGTMNSDNWLSAPLNPTSYGQQWIEVEYPMPQQFNTLLLTSPDRPEVNRTTKEFSVSVYNDDTSSWDIVFNSEVLNSWKRKETRKFKFDYTPMGKRFRINIKNNHGDLFHHHLGKIVYGFER